MSISPSSADWPELPFTYVLELEDSYSEGTLFAKWCEEYCNSFLFCQKILSYGHFPIKPPHRKAPQRSSWGFGELFVGTKYVDAGYDALLLNRSGECSRCYLKTAELLGDRAAKQFYAGPESPSRAPDLLVFDKSGRFRFVECKRKYRKGGSDNLKDNQRLFFAKMENHINQNFDWTCKLLKDPKNSQLFYPLSPRQWIQVARVTPELRIEKAAEIPTSAGLIRSPKPSQRKTATPRDDRPFPISPPGYVRVGRLVMKREKVEDEMRRFLAGEELARTKMQWWRKNLEVAREALFARTDNGNREEIIL